jgi:TetR/AcrR family transcriptional regulator, cholesterol catabolism regulator
MARNRPDRTREDKKAEILAIAREHFREAGYEGTTIAAIAREAGIATNVVHWYFATKDDLFVAVLESFQMEDLEEAQRRFARVARRGADNVLGDLLTEFAWRRLDRYGLLATLHERSHCSPVVAEFHDRAHRRYAEYLGRALDRPFIPAADRKLIVDALIAAVENLVIHRASKREARRMMTFLAERLVAAR